MRIRQVKPEFFTSSDIAALPFRCRVTYIGLWCSSDDDGWFVADPDTLGAHLYPFDGRKARERWIVDDLVLLQERGMVEIEDCGHARVPSLGDHQRFGGRPVYTVRDAHARGCARMRADARYGRVSNGRVSNGNVTVGEATFKEKVAAAGRAE